MSDDNAKARERFLGDKLQAQITHVRLQYVDYAGILRSVVVTKSYAQKLGITPERSYNIEPTALYRNPRQSLPDAAPVTGKVELIPDWKSARREAGPGEHATVMCYVTSKYPNPQNMYAGCPRLTLEQKLKKLDKEFVNHDLKVSFEAQFLITDVDNITSDTTFHISTSPSGRTAAALRSFNGRMRKLLDEATIALQEKAGIQIRCYHAAQQDHVFSIAIDYLPVLNAIDALITTQEAVKSIAIQNGLYASNYQTRNIPTLRLARSDKVETFMAGILHSLPSLLAFTLPNAASFATVADKPEHIGTFVAWGVDNPNVALSRTADGQWELRMCDGTTNFYLAFAAFIAAGLKGLREGLTLGRECTGLPGKEALQNAGTPLKPLSKTMQGALNALKKDEALVKDIGKEAVEGYLVTKEAELASTVDNMDEMRQAYRAYF